MSVVRTGHTQPTVHHFCCTISVSVATKTRLLRTYVRTCTENEVFQTTYVGQHSWCSDVTCYGLTTSYIRIINSLQGVAEGRLYVCSSATICMESSPAMLQPAP